MSELPEYYEFFNPVKILSGLRALDNLPFELELLGAKRPLIVTDKGVVAAGLIRHVTAAFEGSGLEIGTIFDDVPPDSSTETVRRAAEAFRRCGCDCLAAVGGGSPMDTAKAANILLAEDDDDLTKFEGADRLRGPMKPLAAIPTTAGTGSEVTCAAVIRNAEKKVKMGFMSQLLFPRLAVVDPRMTATMPANVAAAGGMDALSHAMEAYTCIQKNPLSDAYAFAAAELIAENLAESVRDPGNAAARAAMANASTMAGAAFGNSMVGMVHSLGHAAGALCGIPHGVAMSIFLPFGLEYNIPKTAPRLSKLLLALAGPDEYAKTKPERRAARTVLFVRRLQRTLHELCGMPRTLREAGVAERRLEEIAGKAADDGTVVFNPRGFDRRDALDVLRQAY